MFKRRSAETYSQTQRTNGCCKRKKVINLTTYRKRKGSDTWHWCKNYSNYPTHDYEETTVYTGRPKSGELCNECRDKEKEGRCS
jgi:hypothetical protein